MSAGALWITPSSTPQLKQWKAFEEESQTMSHMAKYFTSPSRGCRSVYSEEQLYQLIGEKNSMKRLLTEVRGSASPPPPSSPLPFCGLKLLQGGKPFFTALSTLVIPHQPLLEGKSCFVFSHSKAPQFRHNLEGLKQFGREECKRAWFPQPCQTWLI